MKSIVISSNSSGGGKTTATLGIMGALAKKGLTVQGYKVGPDYIDTAFHRSITGKPSRNLDLFLMGEEGVKAAYSRGNGRVGIIEGVMGLYDGKGIDSEYSTAHIARLLNLPVLLVLSPKAQSATICAEINGLVNFENINCAGVIFNNVTESYYRLLKATVEANCSVNVLGYIPSDDRLSIKSRHLGLVQCSEIDDITEKTDLASELVLKHVDIEKLLKCFRETESFEDNFHLENHKIRIAAAYDKAFSFYYAENLELLSEAGELVYFSPVDDRKLPENIDFLYLGGGYPEVFAKELSDNEPMLRNIKSALDCGMKCYAECGGLMYLTQAIEDKNKEQLSKMTGFFNGKAYMTEKLQNFGYASIKVKTENSMLDAGLKINCHEFHKSFVELYEDKIYELQKTLYNGEIRRWECGYVKKNTLGGYGHVHFFNNMDFIKSIIRRDDKK